MADSILKVEGIIKSFGDFQVLKNISFTLEKGQVLAIIGSSGSGKTTLLRCLNFLETPDGGTITVDGKLLIDGAEHKNMTDKEIRSNRLHFGLVFQSFNLFPQYTAFQNITLAPTLAIKEEIKEKNLKGKAALEYKAERIAKIEDNAISLLNRVGLAEKRDFYPCELSGGQCQRVAIARALAMTPDILCFDEPTSALDPELTGEVLNVIRGLKSKDMTMVVVTHEMEFARGVADKVIFMANGIIEEEGTAEEIFSNPKSPNLQAFLNKAKNK